MWRRIKTALLLFGGIALIALLGALANHYHGCAESRHGPSAPTCNLRVESTPRSIAADLVRYNRAWLLAHDAEDGALVITASTSIFLFPATRPASALHDLIAALSPDAKAAVRRSQIVIVWVGRTSDEGQLAWDPQLGVQLFHDTFAKGCLGRITPPDDPELHLSRRRANEHADQATGAERAIVAALRAGSGAPLSPLDSAARLAAAAPKLHEIALVTLRESYAPLSAIVIVALLLLFYWWAASAGKDDSIFELAQDELRGDGALIAPGRIDLRVLSHALLHLDLKHLLNNIVAIWIGCVILEPAIGSARTLIVFLAGVIGGAFVRLRVKRPGLTVGASGGAFALQAAALVLLLHGETWFLASERTGYLIFFGIQLALGLAVSFLPGVSLAGHLGGAFAGFLFTITGLLTLGRPPLDGGSESPTAAAAAWAIAALGVGCWIAAGIWVQRGRTDLTPTPPPDS